MKYFFIILLLISTSFAQNPILDSIENRAVAELENGMKIITVNTDTFDVINYYLFIDFPYFDDSNIKGVKQLLGSLKGMESRGDYTYVKKMVSHKEAVDSLIEFMSSIVTDSLYNEQISNSQINNLKNKTSIFNNRRKYFTDKFAFKTLFGKHQYSYHYSEDSSVANITTDTLNKYYKYIFNPRNTILVIVGNITMDYVKPVVSKYFGQWKNKTNDYGSRPESLQPKTSVLRFVDSLNADTAMWMYGITSEKINFPSDNPDFVVLSEILRYKTNFLSQKFGYTHGDWNIDKYLSSYRLVAKVPYDRLYDYYTELEAMFKDLKTNLQDESLISKIKSEIKKDFLDSLYFPDKVALMAYNITFYKLPSDFYKTYTDKLNKVTAENIRELASKLLSVDKQRITLFGNYQKSVCCLYKMAAAMSVEIYDSAFVLKRKLEKGFSDKYIINRYLHVVSKGKYPENLSVAYLGKFYTDTMEYKLAGKIFHKGKDKFRHQMIVVHGIDTVIFYHLQILNHDKALDSTYFGQKLLTGRNYYLLKKKSYIFPEKFYEDLDIRTRLICEYELDTAGIYKIEIFDKYGNISYDFFDSKSYLKIKSEIYLNPDDEEPFMQIFYRKYIGDKLLLPTLIIQKTKDYKYVFKIDKVNASAKIPNKLFKFKIK